MRAAWYEKQGPAGQVMQVGEVEDPLPGRGEVRVKLTYSGVNPSDIKRREGYGGQVMAFPRIVPHSDGAGVIDAVGPGVPASRVGENVWVWSAQWERPFGTCAELVALPSRQAVAMPGGVELRHGACVGIPAITAHRALFADGRLEGKQVLVTGGAGAVGNYAIQLARWGGAAQVLTTVSSPAKARRARSAGADVAINYKSQDVAGRVLRATGGTGVDHIVEVAFGANLPVTAQVLKRHGVIACYASDTEPEPVLPFYSFMRKNAVLRWVFMYQLPDSAFRRALRDITRWLGGGHVYHSVAKVFPLSKTADAHVYLQSGQANGNVLIDVTK